MIFSSKKAKKKEHRVLRKQKVRKPLSTLQFQIIVGIILSIVIALIVTGIWYGTRIASLQIKNVEVIGGETIPHNVIETKVNQALSGNYLHLVPKHFIPFYPKKSIANSIKQIDRIKNVQIEISKKQTLTVIFDEYIPYALWCEKEDSVSCLFIDQQGYAFAQAPELQGTAFVRYVHTGVTPMKDTVGFDQSFMHDTKVFTDLLSEQLSLYVTRVTQVDPYDIEYTISGGGVLKVSREMPMQTTFDNLKTILNSDQFSHLAPGAFQYIDLRFGDKVFLNDTVPNAASSSATSTS